MTLIEHVVQFLAKQLTMKYHLLLQMILLNNWREDLLHVFRLNTAYNMEEDVRQTVACLNPLAIILTKPLHDTVKPVPGMNLGNTYQVKRCMMGRLRRVKGDAV